jgi:predicted nuclease of restriction endonuclease-like (RecB) superfamily
VGIPLYRRVREIIESGRLGASRSVNTAQVVSNWLIGREIVEEEQRGRRRAAYGVSLLQDLSDRLMAEFGSGYSESNLYHFRKFFLCFPRLFGRVQIPHTLCVKSLAVGVVRSGVTGGEWKAGGFNPNLSWSHYRALLGIDDDGVRSFYEIETVKNGWSVRELQRQAHSMLYERLAVSRDRRGLLRLAEKGQEVSRPSDIFKDPFVMEFVGLPDSPKLVETDLEQALLSNLQSFLLELGKGFAFVARQERLTLEGDHFYIDLVFYHTVLKCFVIIDLKAGKLTHQDLGQLQFYVNYYDRNRRSEGDNPTLGLILCADKNDAVVRYTLGSDQKDTIFASRYKLHLPSEAELRAELRAEVDRISGISQKEG